MCAVSLTLPEGFAATTCGDFLVALGAKMAFGNDGDLAAQVGEWAIQPTDVSGVVEALICDARTAVAPEGLCPQGQACILVSNGYTSTITVYDEQGHEIATPAGAFPNLDQPDGIAYDGNNGFIYAMNLGNSTITAYDLGGNQIPQSATFNFPIQNVRGEDVKYDAANDYLYVNDPTDNQILVYDASTGSPVQTTGGFPGIDQPFGAFWNLATDEIYVSNAGNGTITVYDQSGAPLQSSGNFGGLESPDDFAADPATGNLYVTEASQNASGLCVFSGLVEFDLNGNNITQPSAFSTVNCPDDVLIDRGHIYVTNINGNNITVYDTSGKDITSQVAPGGFPGLNGPDGIVLVSACREWRGRSASRRIVAGRPTVAHRPQLAPRGLRDGSRRERARSRRRTLSRAIAAQSVGWRR